MVFCSVDSWYVKTHMLLKAVMISTDHYISQSVTVLATVPRYLEAS